MTTMDRRRDLMVVRLVVAGALLWWDERFFLFCAFVELLRLFYEVDRVRAMIRVYQMVLEARTLGIFRHLGASPDATKDGMYESLQKLEPRARADLQDDIDLVCGFRDLFRRWIRNPAPSE